jgi:hypothetical protein
MENQKVCGGEEVQAKEPLTAVDFFWAWVSRDFETPSHDETGSINNWKGKEKLKFIWQPLKD